MYVSVCVCACKCVFMCMRMLRRSVYRQSVIHETGFLCCPGPPDGYDFDFSSGDAPINDDSRLEGVNVDDRVDGFVKRCQDLSNLYRTVCVWSR